MNQIEMGKPNSDDHTLALWWLSGALVATGYFWFTRTDLVGSVMGGVFAALLMWTNYELIQTRWLAFILDHSRVVIGFALVTLKALLILENEEYSLEAYTAFRFQEGAGIACFVIGSLVLLYCQGKKGMLRSQMKEGPAATANGEEALAATVTGSRAEVVLTSFLGRHPFLRHSALVVGLVVLFVYSVMLLNYAFKLPVVSYSVGQIQSIDTHTFCSTRYCRLLISADKGQFRVEPGKFRVGDDAHLTRSAFNGTRFCVRDECEIAAVHTESDELRKALSLRE